MPRDTRSSERPSAFTVPSHGEGTQGGARDGNLFVWTILIIALAGVAIGCWIGSFYIFGHPEKPFSYGMLTKLKKLDPPKRFELTAAPRGEFLPAPKLLERYAGMSPRELARANEALLRNYIRNYKLTRDLVPYVVGTFNILDSFELTKSDIFESGVVALARSKETPAVLIEQIFTADERAIPSLHRTLLTGLDIDLKRENELSAVVHVEKLPGGAIKATAISILYPSYESSTAAGTFSLAPPAHLNVAAGLPVIAAHRQQEAEDKYGSFRRRAGLREADAQPKPPQTRLVRVERPVAASPLPAAPVLPDDAPVRAAIPVQPEPSVAPGVPGTAQPFVAAPTGTPLPSPSPAPAIAAASDGAWPVYSPGQMPRGRLFTIRDMQNISEGDISNERTYLQGNFLVSATGSNRAVLRAQGTVTESMGLGAGGNVRIIVEFPLGTQPPAEGLTFSRDARRPFQITEIKQGGDGHVNVYAREITRP